MTESVYKVIELIGTSKDFLEERPRPRSKGPENLLGIFGLPKLPSSICNSMPRARSKPTAPSSKSRSNSRTDYSLERDG